MSAHDYLANSPAILTKNFPGQQRGQALGLLAAMTYLVSRGVSASRITVVTYGEDRPVCREHTEECWAKNRRGHVLVKAQ